MENENEVHRGYLLIPASGKLLMKKSWHQKYCYLFKASKFGVERLEIWDSPDKKGAPVRIVTLKNCIKITSEDDKRFTVTTQACVWEFLALTVDEKAMWVSAFQSVAFPDDMSALTSIEEDNDLYCSSAEGIFHVKIHPSPASERCGLDPHAQYTLVLNSTAMQLKITYEGVVLYTWPYCFIRRYGYKGGKFTFEAGRKCHSGEGTFFLEHSNQQEIFRCLASKMKSMKKLLSEDNASSMGPLLECGDNQFQAALSMEARSRSPLPPSPTSSTTLHDVDPPSTHSAEISDKKLRPKPQKPPRKSIPMKKLPDNTCKPVDKYDRIEYRNDAWRTLGVADVSHTETLVEEDSEYMSWGDHKPTNAVLPTAPKIITQTSTDDNYDKLEFFGSSNKLNVKSGYKQVSVASGLNHVPAFNDYDEVQPAMEEIRIADDKHRGYALVRKTSRERPEIDHRYHNNDPYAVISKPKRV